MTLATRSLFRHPLTLLMAGAMVACTDPVGEDTPYVVVPVTTATLAGTPGWALTDTLVVEVRDAQGHPVPGAQVQWSLPQGGSMAIQLADADHPMTGTADDHGRNYAVWTLGMSEGTQVARAVSGLTGTPAEFEAATTVLHVLSVSAGGSHTCAVLLDQRAVCWGWNTYGQLGTGDTVARTTPTLVAGLPAALEIRAGLGGTTCARDLGGDVWCWGSNGAGEAGPAAAQPSQLTPVRVAGAEGAVALAVTTRLSRPYPGYTCAVLATGDAACWGDNGVGQLGTGDTISSSTPRLVVGNSRFTSVYGAAGRSCALDADREVWCWGDASQGELSPLPMGMYTTPVRPVPGFRFFSLELTSYAQCGIQSEGIARCWGDEFKYGVGTYTGGGTYGLTTSPVHPDLREPLAQLVSNGGIAVYARSRSGTGFMWGGLGNDHDYAPAVKISKDLRIGDISGGGNQTCMIVDNSGLYCGEPEWWASNSYPQGVPGSLRGIPDSISP